MDVAAQPGLGISRNLASSPIAPGEAVGHELNTFIERRYEQRVASEGERSGEEAWRESERHHEAARRAQNASAWHEYHLATADRLRATLSALVAHHEREAQKYKYLPKGAA